ncbi:MAG: hypothetical protein N2449_01995 [Bacteroidales bacterium]|nr:hypothetical protein [Bacteroidales bacterium]
MLRITKYFICFIVCIALTHFLFAQNNDKTIELKAFQYFNEKQFSEALPLFSQLLSLYPKDERYNLYYAACLVETNQSIDKAIKYLQFAESKSNDPLIKYYLGRAYHLSYQFKEAEEQYNAFKQLAPAKLIKEYNINKLIEMCNNGQDLIRYISDLTVVDNRRIKSENYFYSYDLKEFDGKLVIKPKELKSSIDKKEEPANMVIFLPNNSNIVYYGSYGNNKSNGRDIYRIERLPDGKWGKPENLGNIINTPFDEDFPFLHADGKTLFFSSKGHNSMGGYDIFKSVYDSTSNSWTKPVNLDFPINTPYDDYLYITDKDNMYAYFTSNRETRDNNITVYKIIVDQNPTPREYKDIEEIIQVSKLEVSSLAQIKKAEESRQKSKTEEPQVLFATNEPAKEKVMLTPYTFKPITYKPGMTTQEIASDLRNDNEKILKNSQELSRQSKLAYITAQKRNEKANEKRKQAYELNEKIKTIKDPVQAEQIKQQVFQLIDEAEEYERQAITAFNIAQNFEQIAQEMQKDVAKSQAFANALEKQTTVDEAVVDAANKNKERLQLSQNKYSSLQKELEERKNIQQNKENELLTYEEMFNNTTDSLNAIEKEIAQIQEQINKSNSETEKNLLSLKIDALNRQAEILEAKQIEIAEQKEKLRLDIETLNSENIFIKDFAKQIVTDNRSNEELQKEVVDKNQLKKDIFEKELSADIAVAQTVKERVSHQQKNNPNINRNKAQTTTTKTTTENTNRTQTQPISSAPTSANTATNTPSTTPKNENTTALKAINPLLPSSTSNKNTSLENYQKEQFNVQYYTNILNEQQQKLEIINNAIQKAKDKKEKQLLEQQRAFLIEEIQNNKKSLAESQQKLNQYKQSIASEYELNTTNEELVLNASKYENQYQINFSPVQRKILVEAEQSISNVKSIEQQIAKNNEELKRLENQKQTATNASELKSYENEINKILENQNNLYKEYSLETDKAIKQIQNIYNDILTSVRTYDFTNENIKNASLLEKEIEALKERSVQLRKEAMQTNNIADKLNIYKRAMVLEQIAIEKQKYAIDLYVSGNKLITQNTTPSNTSTNTQNTNNETTSKKSQPIQIELSPEETKKINQYQQEIAQANVKFEQGNTLLKEIEEKKKQATQVYSESRKKEILKDVDIKEKQAFNILTEAHNTYERANNDKYQTYQNQTQQLLQNENIPEDNKRIAIQFINEANFYFEEAQLTRLNAKTTTNTEEKLSMLNRAKLLEDKAIANQEYAIDALTNTDPVIFVATNNLSKVDRLEALDKPIDVEEVVRIKTERILSNFNLTNEEKIKLDQAQEKKAIIQQLNSEAEKYKSKLDIAKEIAANSPNPKERKKAEKSIPKLEKEYFARKFTAAEMTENINDNIYQLYDSKFSSVRPKNNTEETKKGKQLEKNANKLYMQAKQLRDKSFITENPYIAYNYLLQADSLEKLAIEEQEKAFGLYLNLKPLDDELQEYAQKKKNKRAIDELIVIKTPASITPLSSEQVAQIAKEQEEKERKKQMAQTNETTNNKQENDAATNINKPETNISQNNATNIKQQPITNTNANKQPNIENSTKDTNQTKDTVSTKQTPATQNNTTVAQNATKPTPTESTHQIAQNINITPPTPPLPNTTEPETNLTKAQFTTPPPATTAPSLAPKNIKTPMGFSFTPASPYSEANPIPINPPLPDGLVFKVQIGAFNAPVKPDAFKGLSPISGEKLEGSKFFRYFVGLFYSEAAAIMVRDYIRPLGYPDAFVVAFYNGKRISLFEARQLIKQASSSEYEKLLSDEVSKIRNVTSVQPTIAQQTAKQPLNAPATKGSLGPLVNQTNELFYTVQIGVFKNPVSHEALKNITPIYEDHSYGFIRYLVGKFNDRKKAEAEKNKIVALGITDAFVSAYYNGQKITLAQAAQIEAMNPNAIIKTTDEPKQLQITTPEPTATANVDVQNLYFKVQLGVFKDKVPFDIAAKFVQVSAQYGMDQETDANGTTIYFAGKFKSYEQAINCKNSLVEQGFKDAFIIATDGKQRVPINRAKELLKP